MTYGVTIILNGTSSSGKTTLASALQKTFMPQPFMHVSIDKFLHMLPLEFLSSDDEGALGKAMGSAVRGYHECIAVLSKAGNNLIVDHVLENQKVFDHCKSVLEHVPLYFVGVHCSALELQRRERARGDRKPGLAIEQLAAIHVGKIYDVEVDTSIMSSEGCAEKIVTYVGSNPMRKGVMPEGS
jgi:chloramphenicol 3-O phosphotransferase